MGGRSHTSASLESAAVSASGAGFLCADGGFVGVPWAANGEIAAKKIMAAFTNLRLPQFEITKAILRFSRDNHSSYFPSTHLQRFKTNVLHTNMRGMANLLHAAADGAQTQKFRSRSAERRCRPGASPSMIVN